MAKTVIPIQQQIKTNAPIVLPTMISRKVSLEVSVVAVGLTVGLVGVLVECVRVVIGLIVVVVVEPPTGHATLEVNENICKKVISSNAIQEKEANILRADF